MSTCRLNHPLLPLLRRFRYAHRGLHDLAAGVPENTMPAFRRAVEHGFGAELDVHLTRDGRLVVIHDSDLRRLCGADRRADTLTAAAFAELPILGTAEHAPMLEDVLPGAEDNSGLPLMKAEFLNCILYGIPADLNVEDLTGSQVYFRNCSFKSKITDDDNFLNCLGDTDPMFLTIRPEYYFNYRLGNDSPVKEAGNPEFVTPAARTDMDGVDRLKSGNPSLGAYQYVPVPEDDKVKSRRLPR